MTASVAQGIADDHDSHLDTSGLGGHPAGLTTLFFTEMWERFSYYGMRAILMLYMLALPAAGGLGFNMDNASEIYGDYTMAVYLGCIPGGFIADRFLGQRKSIFVGGVIIALGHFCLAFRSLPCFYGGLAMIVFGTGLLKPNMSTLVGKLYSKNDHRRDAGFSIYYMGINLGAFLSPLVCGFLAQSDVFKNWMISMHMDPLDSWHWGFGAAGVGMSLGLLQFVLQKNRLGNVGLSPGDLKKSASAPQAFSADQAANTAQAASAAQAADASANPAARADITEKSSADKEASAAVAFDPPSVSAMESSSETDAKTSAVSPLDDKLSKQDWMKLGALLILFFFSILFWAIWEQGGSSLNVFADKLTNCVLFGWSFPSSWFQSEQSFFVIALAPLFSWLWIKLGEKEPSSPAKFAWGLGLLALGIGVMVPASMRAAHGKVSVFWLTFVYLLQTLGELCLSPVGLSTVTKLAPRKIAAMTMGCWFLTNAMGNKLAGELAKHFDPEKTDSLVSLYGGMGIALALAAVVLILLIPKVRKLMGDVK